MQPKHLRKGTFVLMIVVGVIFSLVAILGATVIWGILGALIIVPLLSTFSLVGRYVRSQLLHLDPWSGLVTMIPPDKKQLTNQEQLIPSCQGMSSEVGSLKVTNEGD